MAGIFFFKVKVATIFFSLLVKNMTDIGILLMTSDKRVIFAKNAKDSAPKLMIVKHYQNPVARIKALYGLDIVMSDEDAIPVHKINMKIATTSTEPPTHKGLLVYESLETFLGEVEYEKRGYPLRCAGWVAHAFAFIKKD